MAIQTVTINVEAQPTADRIQTFLVLSQNENGRQIRFRILGDELPVGCTATLSGEKPDGNVWSKAGTVSDNFVTVNGELSLNLNIDGEMSLDLHMDGEAGTVIKVTEYDTPTYQGQTEVTPDFEGTVLETARKIVLTDITNHALRGLRTDGERRRFRTCG